MSKRINVNPDHYKIAGRERPGDAVAKKPKQSVRKDESRERWQRSRERTVTAPRKPAGKR